MDDKYVCLVTVSFISCFFLFVDFKTREQRGTVSFLQSRGIYNMPTNVVS